MSDRLATEILRAVSRDRGTVILMGVLTVGDTVQIHGGTEIAVQFWAIKPSVGSPAMVLISRGTAIGIGVTPA